MQDQSNNHTTGSPDMISQRGSLKSRLNNY